MSKEELLELINEFGGNTAEVVDRSKKGLVKALFKVLAEQPEIDISGKLDKNMGIENAGKTLIVGEDGNIAVKEEVEPEEV